jgi:hypothetical protein
MLKQPEFLGHLGYLGSQAVGTIQYLPRPEEQLVEISGILVLDEHNVPNCIGEAPFQSALGAIAKPARCIGAGSPRGVVSHAFAVAGGSIHGTRHAPEHIK